MGILKDKVAVVLGASAEGGTGWAIAEGLAAQGAKVVVAARTFEPLERLAKKIGGHAVKCDGGSEADIRNLRDETIKTFGKIDIAVNSAAQPVLSSIADSNQDTLNQGITVNYFGMVHFIREMADAMKGPGSIITVSSMTAIQPSAPHFSYACGKAAMECLVMYAAQEYGPRQIRVNCIRVGTVRSDMARALYEKPGITERFEMEIPLGKMPEPEQIAHAAVFLADNPYMTGCHLDVSGGNQLARFPFMHELPGAREAYAGSGPLASRESGNAF
ncbi:MAG: SDR family oxidoreductase [Caulobacterales bacterium]